MLGAKHVASLNDTWNEYVLEELQLKSLTGAAMSVRSIKVVRESRSALGVGRGLKSRLDAIISLAQYQTAARTGASSVARKRLRTQSTAICRQSMEATMADRS